MLPVSSAEVARLAVGRRALGDSWDGLDRDLRAHPARLVEHVVPLVRLAWRHTELRTPLRRLTYVRRPLPIDTLLAGLGVEPGHEHASLFTAVLTVREGTAIGVSGHLRSALRTALGLAQPKPPHASQHTHHLALAEVCQAVDGVERPEATDCLAGLRWWCDKVHHLAASGPLGAERWAAQDVRQNEQLWERARSLSLAGDHIAAAVLYRRCIANDGDDSYAWHYLGFNLDLAGRERLEAEEAFARAVELDPTNAWWNGRLVTFLIGQVRYRDAEAACEEALATIDPSGARVDPWLVHHFYRHVVNAWLDAGELRRARRAFDTIPGALRSDPSCHEIERRLVDMEEAFVLGGAMRPYGLLGEARWEPRQLPAAVEGRALARWYAGRIVKVGADGVQIRAATTKDDLRSRRLLAATISASEWRVWGGPLLGPQLEGRFVEIREYGEVGDTVTVVGVLDASSVPRRDPAGRAWLDAWTEP